MYAKRSVSTRIAKYLFVVIIFMGIISSLSLLVMASNKSDAEAINISGSLRMQSYRLLTEMERSLDTVEQNLVRYQRSLNADALLTVQNQLFAPSGVRESYQKILQRWAVMSDFARAHQIEKYHAELKVMYKMSTISCWNYNVLLKRNGSLRFRCCVFLCCLF